METKPWWTALPWQLPRLESSGLAGQQHWEHLRCPAGADSSGWTELCFHFIYLFKLLWYNNQVCRWIQITSSSGRKQNFPMLKSTNSQYFKKRRGDSLPGCLRVTLTIQPALAVLAYLQVMMLFNSSYPWLSTLPFSKRLLVSSQRQFSCLWSSCWTVPVYSPAYSDKLPFIPLNILCCNLQDPENHPFFTSISDVKSVF